MKPHVAILPSPGMGHITPLLEFAKRLVTHHGFHVSFLAITTEASAAQTQLLLSPTLPLGLHVINLPPLDVSALVSDNMGVSDRILFIVKETLKSLRSILMPLHHPKALIVDVFCIDALDIANDLSIPTYLFFTASAALLALSLYFPTLDREVNGVYTDLHGAVQVPGCTPMPVDDLIHDVLKREILPILTRLPEVTGIFVNTWEELEPVSLCAMRENAFFLQLPTPPPVYSIGPVIKEDEPVMSSEAECLTWLDKQPSDSVLYVSFGSGGTLSTEQVSELAWGLELSRQRFIWVARKPTDASGSGVFFNVGSEVDDPTTYLPEGFLERNRGVGLVVPTWAPQVAVLRHRSTGGFLSHCGWNSLLESIVHGVPMIAWPLYADQRINTRILTEEIGVAVRPVILHGQGMIGREEVARVVREMMEGDEGRVMRLRAKEVQDTALKAQNGPSYDSLSYVAEAWRGRDIV